MTHGLPANGGAPLGLLRFRGVDAGKFLQGQLSNDMKALNAATFVLAGLHNPQGRVLALLRLVAPADDHIVALLPAELVGGTAATLRRFVLRAKVVIGEETYAGALAEFARQVPSAAAILAPTARALEISAGVPQVYAETSGRFVAQMLNLDCVGAISFDKGCYTGQEIIARTHYRGRMKRRMQRFLSTVPVSLAPGQAIVLGDGRAAQVVDAIERTGGATEFLAVAARADGSDGAVASGDAGVDASGDAGGTAQAGAGRLECRSLPLPYAFPD